MSSSAAEEPKSASDCAVAEAGTYCGSPPPVSPLLPRNCTVSAITSTAWRFEPSCASHSRHSSRPSTPTGRPFERYCAQFSPWLPQTVRSEEHTSELQSRPHLVCRLLLEKKKTQT